MARQNGYTVVTDLRSNPGGTVQRRRRKQSVKIERNIDEDALMASAIGDVTWLQQSLYDTRKVYSVSKEHVRKWKQGLFSSAFFYYHLRRTKMHFRGIMFKVRRFKRIYIFVTFYILVY